MSPFSSVSFLVIIISLVNLVSGFAFTDINFDKLSDYFEQNDTDSVPSEEDMKKFKLSLLYPGTKWCGPGNSAENNDDLGTKNETDKCCRQHDMCSDLIIGGETKHNLTNSAKYTRLNCECDLTFRNCLHNANSTTADHIGVIYFDVLGTQCYKQEYPIEGCKKRGGILFRKCVNYTLDEEGEKRYQWFDVPNY